MKKCVNCGKIEESNNVMECSSCGGELEIVEEKKSTEMKCPNCNKVLHTGVAFCNSCGTKISDANPYHENPPRRYGGPMYYTNPPHGEMIPARRRKSPELVALIVILIVLLIASVCVCAVFYIDIKNDDSGMKVDTPAPDDPVNQKEELPELDKKGNLIGSDGEVILTSEDIKSLNEDSDGGNIKGYTIDKKGNLVDKKGNVVAEKDEVAEVLAGDIDIPKPPEKPKITHKVYVSDLDWYTARNAAISNGGQLVSINSANEFSEICSLAEAQGIDVLWVGACRSSYETWADATWEDGTYLTYTKWRKGEPSYYDYSQDSVPEECYLMLYRDSSGWSFNDAEYDVSKFYGGNMGYAVEFD